MPARPTIRARQLGSELRRLREAANKSTDEAAAHLECSRPKISRIETGSVAARPIDVRALLDMYAVHDAATRDALLELARQSGRRGWWRDYGDTLPKPYEDFVGLEAEASYIRTWQTSLIPGLLQTVDYARAITAANPASTTPETVEQLVKVRMERQNAVMNRPDPPRFWAVIWEPALRVPVGGRDVMRAQLAHLSELVARPTTTVQVLKTKKGEIACVARPFVVFAFPPPAPDVVFLENLTSSNYLEGENEVADHILTFDYLRSSAESPADSLTLINQVIAEL
ncbi:MULTISPECIES: helix-turn-helix transcriptional regulator [unclassified Embleya]|uniref:helix-turn-helix domain-containing protein n=1 Tax=unclassified Embleya TaxID=2699296 RepID=UPI00340D32C7